jgi:hypothetical protein
MFQPHDQLEQPSDKAVLWRYQDLPRYVDMLLKGQLFFSRADKFEDPFEGQFTRHSKQKLLRDRLERLAEHGDDEENLRRVREQVEELTKEHIDKRTFITINSWHFNENENYAMWKIYAHGDYGIALQTTYDRLKSCFNKTDKTIHIGKVKYYDESSDQIPIEDTLIPFFRKRRIYEYENEVRCCHPIPQEEKEFIWQEQDYYDGIFVNVDLNQLVERIYISPYSPKWIRDIVAGINQKFNIEKEIVHSTVFDSEEY